ncbi:single-stranded DNA-binding protein [Deinococcus sp.]|uniref:single-stranded DNA-binding protein n=1 Tax=Deinococcus sp. TaxID=47478 RepID=UPI0025E675AA|nr:single-stranded DNA-binding protein [Deinococcus sp.]
MSDVALIREALRAALSAWAVAEVRGDQARVLPVPDLDTLDAHLSAADPTWSLSWKIESVSPPMVRAALGLGGAVREGLSGGHSFDDARKLALADAFRFYGVASAIEAPWVEYDPDDGPNVSELIGESSAGTTEHAPRPGPARPLPPQVPLDPQLSKARAHIDTLVEQLRDGGRGKEAMKIVLRGYGETVDESRAIYKELQALQRHGG